MSKKTEIWHHQSKPDTGNRAYSDYRSAKQEAKRNAENFSNVTKYLNGKEARLLKNNMGLFEFPETWDIRLDDDNVKN